MKDYTDYPNAVFVGDIPRPTPIRVTEEDGTPVNLSEYVVSVLLFDPDNRPVDMTGHALINVDDYEQRLRWPTSESVFNRQGVYTTQIQLINEVGESVKTMQVLFNCLPVGRPLHQRS